MESTGNSDGFKGLLFRGDGGFWNKDSGSSNDFFNGLFGGKLPFLFKNKFPSENKDGQAPSKGDGNITPPVTDNGNKPTPPKTDGEQSPALGNEGRPMPPSTDAEQLPSTGNGNIPSNPSPSTPAPSNPAPSNPAPSTPAPSTPAPAEPTNPAPSSPAPAEPTSPGPSTPAPSNPAPRPDSGQNSTSNGGAVDPTEVTSTFSVAGGRVNTLQVRNSETVESIRILNKPDHGNLTVNPDNTLALVLSHDPSFSGQIDFSYEVTYANGSTLVESSRVNVEPVTQQAGWAQGNIFMLEEGPDGQIVVEHGDNHRAVHISGSNNALSLADIAAREGLSEGQITGRWLAANAEYGSNPGLALNAEAGMRLWSEITGTNAGPSSNWLLLERGYEYNGLGGIIEWGTTGESQLHPIHITAYGEGDKPVLNSAITIFGDRPVENVVISNLELTRGIMSLEGSNLILDNLDVTNTSNSAGKMGIQVDNGTGITIHDSMVHDVYYTTPPNGAGGWSGNEMASGLLMGNNTGVLVEGSVFDQNGWAPNYRADLSTAGGQPPGVFSHNVYINWNNDDVTFRDNITMRAANNGAMVRSGGFIEDNVIMDSNAGGNFAGGNFGGSGQVGHFTLFADNVITSAGHHASSATGFLSLGLDNTGVDTTLIDNIIAHLADPANAAEMREKSVTNAGLNNGFAPFFDDTIIYNWSRDSNTQGLNTSALDATTIQRFTQQLLGDSNAGIPELANHLRAQASGRLDGYVDADVIIGFFQAGFGVGVDARMTPTTVQFVPSDLGDGLRWDNRLNWTSEDLPGTVAGDSVNLGGNHVNYGGTTTIQNFALGNGGVLSVGNGRLTVEGNTTVGTGGGTVDIFNAGQFWMDGYQGRGALRVNVDEGRFANTGDVSGNLQTTVTGGQAILATDGASFDVSSGSRLSIQGSDAKVGFDGSNGDTAVLRLAGDGVLSFMADADGFAFIEEFRSGRLGDAPNVASGVNLGLGTLELDVSALSGRAGQYMLMAADELIGQLSDVELTGLARNANATLVVDYVEDTVYLDLTNGGNGSFNIREVGSESNMNHANAADIRSALTDGYSAWADSIATDLSVSYL